MGSFGRRRSDVPHLAVQHGFHGHDRQRRPRWEHRILTNGSMEQIQANLDSGALPELVYGRNEPPLIHYHREIDQLIGT